MRKEAFCCLPLRFVSYSKFYRLPSHRPMRIPFAVESLVVIAVVFAVESVLALGRLFCDVP